MKRTLYIAFLIMIKWSYGQSIHGLVLDSTSQEPVPYINVINESQNLLAVTDHQGKFTIKGNPGDTLIFSSVGYKLLGYRVNQSLLTGIHKFILSRDTLMLEEVVVNEMISEEAFKSKVLEYDPEPEFWYHGVSTVQNKENPELTGETLRKPLYALSHPASFLYQRFSKREKEKRELYQLEKTQRTTHYVQEKFTREWVGEVTQLIDDELTYFIQYCDFSEQYIANTPLYILREELLAKLESFKKQSPKG